MIRINVMTRAIQRTLNNRRSRERNPDRTRATTRRSHHKMYATNPDRILAYNKAQHTPEKTKEWNHHASFGKGSYAHFVTQIEKQHNLCAICRRPFPSSKGTHFDHNHETKQWRGALCANCNQGLGQFKENIQTLQNAIDYLKFWSSPSTALPTKSSFDDLEHQQHAIQ